MNKVKETRNIRELRAINDEEMIIEGYAAVYNELADLGWFKEIITQGAFDGADMSDCSLKYNHDSRFMSLARTRNNSLMLIPDDKGLKIKAKLIDTTNNRDIYTMIKEGMLDKMSFGFIVSEKEEEWNYETDTRTIKKFEKIFDVSIVEEPAYEGTSVYARNKEQLEKEKESYIKQKELNFEKEKLKLILSI